MLPDWVSCCLVQFHFMRRLGPQQLRTHIMNTLELETLKATLRRRGSHKRLGLGLPKVALGLGPPALQNDCNSGNSSSSSSSAHWLSLATGRSVLPSMGLHGPVESLDGIG